MTERSFNEVAADIIDRAPECEALVEEWFALLDGQRRRWGAADEVYGIVYRLIEEGKTDLALNELHAAAASREQKP